MKCALERRVDQRWKEPRLERGIPRKLQPSGSLWDAFQYAERNDGLYDAQWFGGAFDAMLGELVKRQAFIVKAPEAGFVLEEWTVSDVRTALHQFFDGTLKPDGRAFRLSEQFEICGLGHSAAAERNDGGFGGCVCFTKNALQFLVLGLAEGRFAQLREYRRDSHAEALGDAFIEVGVNPADLTSEKASDGGFATTHKSRERQQTAIDAHGWR